MSAVSIASSAQRKAQVSLYRACKHNKAARAGAALAQGASTEQPDGTGGDNYPLHIAAMFGAIHVIQLLADRGADLYALNQRGRTPLDVARRIGEKEAAALLEALAEGRRVHLEGSGDDDEDEEEAQQAAQDALFRACRRDETSWATEAILGGADVDAAERGDSADNGPVHVAAIYGSAALIELLHHFRAALGAPNGEGLTPLELARRADQPRAVALLESLLRSGRGDAGPDPHGGGGGGGTGPPHGPQGGGAAALDGVVAFGEAPHGQVEPQHAPHDVDVFGANGQPLPRFRARGG